MTHITIKRAELEQWLEKLQDVSEKVDYYGNDLMVGDEINAIKEALAQPAQQEPVAWMDIDEKGSASGLRYWSEPDNRHEVALYTTPPQRTWVGLDEKDFSAINQSCLTKLQAATSAESVLKEKNT